MNDLQTSIEAAERIAQKAIDQAGEDLAMNLIDLREYDMRLRVAEDDMQAAIAFAWVVAEWEAGPIIHPTPGDNGTRTGA